MSRSGLYVGLAAIFLGLSTLAIVAARILIDRAAVNRSMSALRVLDPSSARFGQRDDGTLRARVLSPARLRLVALGRRLTPDGQVERYRHRLELAGSPPRWDPDRILAVKTLGLLLGAPFGLGVGFLVGGLVPAIVLAGAGGALGFFSSDLWLWRLADRRRERMRRELPDALDLLTISVEAGLAFDAALSYVARTTTGPLAEEFVRVLQEMQIGVGRPEAMKALAERTDVPELRSFISAMVQADTFGVSVSNVLRVQAREMRVKRSQRAEEAAQKVPVKIIFPLILCIMPALFIVIIGPAVINLVHTFRGGR